MEHNQTRTQQVGKQGAYIHGRARPSTHGAERQLYNPATGEEFGACLISDPGLLSEAVASAQQGFEQWRNTAVEQRARVLRRAADLLLARKDELASIEALNTGRPISETLEIDVVSGAECLNYFASCIETARNHFVEGCGSFYYSLREPLGICLGLGAWNYPLQIACWKSAPALACGNVMIFKPSELTPATAHLLAEIYYEAGLPAGVFNVVQGGGEVAQSLLHHPAVRKVSLTGSVPTGRLVAKAAGEALKPVSLELGGKSPLILFADAGVDQAVKGALLANFYSCGQVCSNATRVYVQDGLYDTFVQTLLREVKKIKIGHPLDPETQMGPLISREQYQKVRNYIVLGDREGAKRLCGGETPFVGEHPLASGYFMEPVVFTECTDDMTIVRDEIFGPVMTVLRFKEEEEAVARSNDTAFGLGAGVFTQNLARAHRVAKSLRAGMCWVNTYNVTPVSMPFGGIKDSGIGRENGWEVLEHYSHNKSVYVELKPC